MAFTYFFRDMQTLELIADRVLPELKGHRYIDVWDAGCAHGPEPFSVAIMLRERMTRFLFRNVRVFATDLDGSSQFGDIIGKGIYPEAEIKRIPQPIREKYFSATDRPGYYIISDEIRARVSFAQHDLLTLEPIRKGFSLIVCKNVLLHFNEEQRAAVIRMFHSALRDGGYLATEHTQKMPHQTEHLFEQVTGQGQVFKKVTACVSESNVTEMAGIAI